MLKPTLPPIAPRATSFCARKQRTIPSREATNEGHQRKGTLQHSQSVFDRLRGALRNLPTMSRLNRTENRHFSWVESIMAASTRFRNLSSIALFVSLMTIPVAPAFAQTLSYQPADRGLAFPQYAPQP